MDNDSVVHMSYEKLKADHYRYENQTRHIRSSQEYFPAVDKYGVVKAGEGLGLFDLRFDFFGCFAVSGGDYKDLSSSILRLPVGWQPQAQLGDGSAT
ncbi:unnamed protein product [marine sediment metagenome]|uniref:Uncharacterized protein n=1 Tax=marine sediment metagenome TaxID=412755 RepID=X1VBD2_9ZZZZ